MKRILLSLLALGAAAAGVWALVLRPDGGAQVPYRFGEVTRGDLESVVSGTGTLSAVGTVEVGTQVSGTIDQLYADFNDHVRAGQLLARLDTSALAASLRDAEAALARARAEHSRAVDQYDRNVPLAAQGFISDLDLRSLATQVETARAGVQSAEAGVWRGRTNLEHARIHAPIDGTVIQRSVQAGQTVAASLQAPTLFVIAQDLARMEILALVDESDIGQIRPGQEARFTVQAYPERVFHGRVSQVRLQPQTVQNVVNYTVVVEAGNEDGVLLPGMTATVDFVVERVADVLRAPAAALRLQPTDEMLAQVRPGSGEHRTWAPQAGQGSGGKVPRLWYLDEGGRLAVVPVRTGATDGVNTAVEPLPRSPDGQAPALGEGMRVITGLVTPADGRQSAAASAAQSRSRGRMGPPPLF
ncbi:MAG: efflux RND transporter periplasmic adaptor subunit [Candidatus Latescibacterota bacterium]